MRFDSFMDGEKSIGEEKSLNSFPEGTPTIPQSLRLREVT